MSYKCTTINSYHIVGYSQENIELFYDEVEINLCIRLNSGFGRNLDSLSDLFRGNCGILQDSTTTNRFHIHIKKSKLLDESIKQLLEQCNQENKFIKIFLE
jgi:hypothetical protein